MRPPLPRSVLCWSSRKLLRGGMGELRKFITSPGDLPADPGHQGAPKVASEAPGAGAEPALPTPPPPACESASAGEGSARAARFAQLLKLRQTRGACGALTGISGGLLRGDGGGVLGL